MMKERGKMEGESRVDMETHKRKTMSFDSLRDANYSSRAISPCECSTSSGADIQNNF